jgi:CysZ protein
MITDFARGFYYFLLGTKLIREPTILPYIWVPLICNVILFAIMLFFAAYGLNHFVHWIVHFLPSWLTWLYWLIWLLSVLFSAIVLVYISMLIVNIVAGPFNSLLSEKVTEYLKMGDKPQSISLIKALPAAFTRQMHFLIYYLPRAIFFLLLFIIPVVQIVAAIIWFLFNGWVFTMQYLDYPMDNHGVSIKQMLLLMKDKPGVCYGFGSAVVLFAMIPLVNFIIVPVAAVGATLLWAKEFSSRAA